MVSRPELQGSRRRAESFGRSLEQSAGIGTVVEKTGSATQRLVGGTLAPSRCSLRRRRTMKSWRMRSTKEMGNRNTTYNPNMYSPSNDLKITPLSARK